MKKDLPLDTFLKSNRQKILEASEKRIVALAALRPSSGQLRNAMSLFLDQLTSIIITDTQKISTKDELEISESASRHGKELWRLGYTLTHVVHTYGAMCQAITEVASNSKNSITAMEFHHLNRCLDIAIAAAVTEFGLVAHIESKKKEVIHLGAVAHELRNALNRASIAFQMLSKGIVGLNGSTSKILEKSLIEIGILINRSLSEVRLRSESELHEEHFAIIEVINQLIVTAEIEAEYKMQTLTVQVDPEACIKADRYLILAAVGNTLQNALKYTKEKGNITIIGRSEEKYVFIEIKDQCGGIPVDKVDDLFKAFTQENKDRSGLGLGLLITKNAIERSSGTITACNLDDGCIFTIKLPRSFPSEPESKSVV